MRRIEITALSRCLNLKNLSLKNLFLLTNFSFILFNTLCYAGISMSTHVRDYQEVRDRQSAILNETPLYSRLKVCIAVIINNNRMIHILPTEHMPAPIDVHLREIFNGIQPGDSVSVIQSGEMPPMEEIMTGEIVKWYLQHRMRVKDVSLYDNPLEKYFRYVVLDEDGWYVVDQDETKLQGAGHYAYSEVVR